MNILVTLPEIDGKNSFITPEIESMLESMGNVTWNPFNRQFSADELKDYIRETDVCITGWGCPTLDRYILESAGRLKLVAHTGGSVATLVSPYLYDRGIRVISGNRIFAESVAEGVLAYILCSLRNIPYYSQDMKAGGWQTGGFMSEGLLDQDIGLVGFGMVAKYLVSMLRPFRVKIKVYDPYVNDDILREYNVEKATLDQIFSTCKIISIHAPKTPDTYHMINKELLEMIPDGSLFVNTARGSIIDENALVKELQKGRFKAVLDVYETEPLPSDSILRKLDNVILMPHMAGPTYDRRKTVTLALIEDIRNFFSGKQMVHEISREYAMAMTR